MITFKKWLETYYGEADHRYNDLLEDAVKDNDYPWRKGYEEQIHYLMSKHAAMLCLETLRDAFFDYLIEGE